MSDPVLVIGADQKVLLANTHAEDLFEPDIAGRHILSIIRQPDALLAIQHVLAGKPEARAKFVAHRQIDETYNLRASALNQNGAGLDGAVVSFVDITPIENAEQIRSDFVANVSHELRSPLTALSGFIETLQGPAADDPEARADFLTIMQTETNRMRRLTDDLLSLSRVEANERVRPTAPVDVIAVLHAVIATLAPLAKTQKTVLCVHADPAIPLLPGDVDQLTQVFHNLIENALKYSGGGAVDITVTPLDRFAGIFGPVIKVQICDQGAGIAPHHLLRLTERFYRIDDHRSRGLGGTGLGLAIVKHITNRHRGRLVINSEMGQGSTFSVVLPVT